MAKKISTKRWMNGHQVSHSNIKTKKRWNVNLQSKRIFDTETGRYMRVRISTSDLRTLNKMSLSEFLRRGKAEK